MLLQRVGLRVIEPSVMIKLEAFIANEPSWSFGHWAPSRIVVTENVVTRIALLAQQLRQKTAAIVVAR